MKKLFTLFMTATLCTSMFLAACGPADPAGGGGGDGDGDGEADHGTMTIADITLEQDESVTIEPVFSVPYDGEVTYAFRGTDISIENGVVTGEKANTTTKVTATTEYDSHKTHFNVTVVPKTVVGFEVIPPANVYANYSAQPLTVKFYNMAETAVTYTVEEAYKDKVFIENNKIRAAGNFSVKPVNVLVNAQAGEYKTSFRVPVSIFDGANAAGDPLGFESLMQSYLTKWETERSSEKGGVLFVGDSFFDTRYFWTDFYSNPRLVGKNALCFGVSSSTTTDWEIASERIVYPLEPKAIVIHCGTNNIFDDRKNASAALADIERLVGLYLENTEATVYLCGIEPRTGSGDASGNATAKQVNEGLIAYCGEQTRVVYLNSPVFCFVGGDIDGAIDTNFFRDTVHPKLEKYDLYLNALETLGLTYGASLADTVRSIPDITGTKDQLMAVTSRSISYRGKSLTDNYVIEGTIEITDNKSNPHVSFSFDASNFNNRFLLWDSDTNGQYGLGWAKNGDHVNENAAGGTKYSANGEVFTLQFRLVMKNGTARMYLKQGGEFTLQGTFEGAPTSGLIIGMEGITGSIKNMTACTLADDPEEFNQATAGI